MTRLLALLGGAALVALVVWLGAGRIGHEVLRAWWAVPLAVAWHAGQLGVSSLAWRRLAGGRLAGRVPALPAALWWRVRWIRESVNSLLPVAQIGGNLVGIRLLAGAGLGLARAAAATVLDLACEAASQALYTLAAIAVLAAGGTDRHWLPWVAGSLAALVAGTAGLAAAQRLGLLRLIEGLGRRLGLPGLRGLDSETRRLAGDARALLAATGLHAVAWSLGTAETALVLAAMGALPSLAAAFVVECLGMAARSAAFVVPGALGVQEGGLILICGLYGIPAETAIALSMVKRARELAVGAGGLLAWQWGRPATAAALERSDG